MALKKKKATKEKAPSYEITLRNVILSYPVLAKPKPFKGKSYYSLDSLMSKKHPQIKELQSLITKARKDAYGDDKTEWPDDMKEFILDGDKNEGSEGYAGKYYIKASTQTAVGVYGMDKKPIPASTVKGGMWGNVGLTIKSWENDGDTGVSVYLGAVQVNEEKEYKAFGGGKSAEGWFGGEDNDEEENESEEEDESDDDEDEEEERKPIKKKKKAVIIDDDEDEEEDDEDE